MQSLRFQLSNRAGFTLILSVMLIVVLIGAAAFAVDVGHVQVQQADVHAASDAAALAGIEKYAATGFDTAALHEAQLFAGKFRADAATLALAPADFSMGHWDSTAATFTAGGTPTNAAQAIVRHTLTYVFAPLLGVSSHATSAKSIAVGVASSSITKSSCVSPVVMSFGQLLTQLGGNRSLSDTLTQTDINALAQATAGKAVTLDIPNGTKVNGVGTGEFYQINLPPAETANGTVQSSGPPSASDFRNGFTCTGGGSTIGVGDWVEPINGQKANKAKQGLDAINNSTFPVTIEVALAASFGNSPHGGCTGCFQITYLGSFVVTSVANKSVTGYFDILTPPAGGIVASGPSSGPLEKIAKIRLVF